VTLLPPRHAELDSASQRETLKQVQGDAKVVVFRVTQRQKRDAEAIGVKRENRFTPFFCLARSVAGSETVGGGISRSL